MYNKDERKIIAQTSCLFFMGSEYGGLKETCSVLKKKIDNKLLLDKISRIEMMLKERIQLEILYSYSCGCEKAKTSKKYFDFDPLTLSLDDNIDFNRLYNNSAEYQRIYNSLKEAENDLCLCVKFDSGLSKTVDLLLEAYSAFSYELAKTAFIVGYSLNIPYATVDIKPKQSFKNEREMIGAKLLYCRKSAKMTQQELGEKLNVERTRISLFENGKAMPSVPLSLAFAEYFNIELDDLIDSNVSLDMFIKKYF